jgi:hypothetical protein
MAPRVPALRGRLGMVSQVGRGIRVGLFVAWKESALACGKEGESYEE